MTTLFATASLVFVCFHLVVFLLEDKLSKNLYVKINGNAQGYRLKSFLNRIKTEQGIVNLEQMNMAKRIMLLDRMSVLFLTMSALLFFASLISR